jgi:hypothetical protein
MKSYRVIMLGASGAGKTVFLASMFKQLSVQGEDGFFLDMKDREKAKALTNIFLQVATGEKWPAGTHVAEISEWNFSICVQTKGLPIHSACEFTYLDYAGGRLTEVMEHDPRFYTLLEESDALLGLLDGQKVLSMMEKRNDRFATTFELVDIPSLVRIMQKGQSHNPVHFVISKWDLLNGEYSLGDIRQRLMEVPEFSRLVENRKKAGSTIRLIPVSSVGKGFAALQPDGTMRKSGQAPHPYQIEMPLACVLPDRMRLELTRLMNKRKELEQKQTEVKADLSWWEEMCGFLGEVINAVKDLLPERFQYGAEVLKRLVDLASAEPLKKKEDAIRRSEQRRLEKEATLNAVNSEETALNHVIACFGHIESKLEVSFPESLL